MCKVHRWVVDQWLCVDLRQSNDSVSEDSVHITPLLVHSALDSFYFKFKNVLQSGTGRSNVSLREAIKSHNRLNLGNHPNLPRPPPHQVGKKSLYLVILPVIIAKVRGWETTLFSETPPPSLSNKKNKI